MTASERSRQGRLMVFRVLFTLFLGATLIFIFYNSSQIGSVSGGRSDDVMRWVNGLLAWLGTDLQLNGYQVRKLAHFSEYLALGFWLLLTLRVYTRRLLAHISWPLFFGLLVPLMDECFQLLIPGRSGQLTDVLIDFSGVLVGLCAASVVVLLLRAFWEGLQGGD